MALWSPERDKILMRMRAEGVSATIIAAEMGDGLTRNAVLGRCHRRGIKLENVVKKRQPKKDNQQAKKPTQRPQGWFDRPKLVMSESVRSPPRPKTRIVCTDADRALADAPLRLSLMDLAPNGCRWPVNDPEPKGEHLFCGHAKRFGPYCAAHAARSVGLGTFGEAMAHKLGWAA